jgi:hypothetical protein
MTRRVEAIKFGSSLVGSREQGPARYDSLVVGQPPVPSGNVHFPRERGSDRVHSRPDKQDDGKTDPYPDNQPRGKLAQLLEVLRIGSTILGTQPPGSNDLKLSRPGNLGPWPAFRWICNPERSLTRTECFRSTASFAAAISLGSPATRTTAIARSVGTSISKSRFGPAIGPKALGA